VSARDVACANCSLRALFLPVGLTVDELETVSRCFTRLRDDGILDVRQRNVRILDAAALQRLVAGTPRSRA